MTTDDDTAAALVAAIRAAQPRIIRLTRVPAPAGRVVLVVETDEPIETDEANHALLPIPSDDQAAR